MSQYRIYVHQKGKLAGARERGIYVDKKGQFYLRHLLANGQEHYQPLGTNQISVARERRDTVLKKQSEAELGIAEDPASAAKKAKTPVAKVIRRYIEDGYADRNGNPRKPGKHLDEEKARCEVLLEYFNGDAPAEDLDQDGLDAYQSFVMATPNRGNDRLALRRSRIPSHARPDHRTGRVDQGQENPMRSACQEIEEIQQQRPGACRLGAGLPLGKPKKDRWVNRVSVCSSTISVSNH